jgi:hypothetical protein
MCQPFIAPSSQPTLKKGKMMVPRPACVYCSFAAFLILIATWFLPIGRGLIEISHTGLYILNIQQIPAEEMGCFVAPTDGSQSFISEGESFWGGSSFLCGKSPIEMLMTGKYTFANLTLMIPGLLGVIALIKLALESTHNVKGDQRLLIVTGLASTIILLLWLAIWVKFRAIPAIGFWISLAGSLFVILMGWLLPQPEFHKRTTA